MGSEKFCLRWNDFESNISSSFSELRDDKDFFDVTLACDDEQIQAHKLIISACSPFFRNVLRRNPHQNPLLYLKGVRFTDLQAVLNFMYHGEVNVAQEDLNSFLAVAEDLRVKGLTQNQASTTSSSSIGSKSPIKPPIPRILEKEPPPIAKRPRPSHTEPQNCSRQDDDIQEVSIKSEPKEPTVSTYSAPQAIHPPAVAPHPQLVPPPQEDHSLATYQEENVYEDYEQYGEDQQYEETNTTMEHITIQNTEHGKGNDRSILLKYVQKEMSGTVPRFQCTLCGKTNAQKNNIMNHVEGIHFPDSFIYQCQICFKTMKTKNALYLHTNTFHKEKS